MPLNTIFAHSEPRKKSAENEADLAKKERSKLFRKSDAATPNHLIKEDKDSDDVTPRFEPVAYDKDSDIEYDEHNNEIILPKDVDIDSDKVNADSRHATNRSDIITEADNPTAN